MSTLTQLFGELFDMIQCSIIPEVHPALSFGVTWGWCCRRGKRHPLVQNHHLGHTDFFFCTRFPTQNCAKETLLYVKLYNILVNLAGGQQDSVQH